MSTTTVRTCPGCGAHHRCRDPLFKMELGQRIEFPHFYERRWGRGTRTMSMDCAGVVIETHPAEYDDKGWIRKSEQLVVECDDGEVRVVDGWLFLQSIGSLRRVA